MRDTFWGYYLILLGVFIIGVMLLVNNISTTNTEDYYNLKEVTHASMIDAVDFSYYRLYGTLKMSETKFVENFVRRFAEDANLSRTYNVEFYDLYEVPPKVSVKISTSTGSFNLANTRDNSFDVTNTITSILEVGATSGDSENNEGDNKLKTCRVIMGSSRKIQKYMIDNKYYSGNLCATNDVECLDSFVRWFDKNYFKSKDLSDTELDLIRNGLVRI